MFKHYPEDIPERTFRIPEDFFELIPGDISVKALWEGDPRTNLFWGIFPMIPLQKELLEISKEKLPKQLLEENRIYSLGIFWEISWRYSSWVNPQFYFVGSTSRWNFRVHSIDYWNFGGLTNILLYSRKNFWGGKRFITYKMEEWTSG